MPLRNGRHGYRLCDLHSTTIFKLHNFIHAVGYLINQSSKQILFETLANAEYYRLSRHYDMHQALLICINGESDLI